MRVLLQSKIANCDRCCLTDQTYIRPGAFSHYPCSSPRGRILLKPQSYQGRATSAMHSPRREGHSSHVTPRTADQQGSERASVPRPEPFVGVAGPGAGRAPQPRRSTPLFCTYHRRSLLIVRSAHRTLQRDETSTSLYYLV